MSNTYTKTACTATALAVLLLALPAQAIDLAREIAHNGFNPERTSISVADVGNGKEMAEHLPDLKLNPASCAKIVTSASALAVLGPDHRFRTHFYADRAPQSGTIGTLYVAGTGDPLLINEELAQIASHLARKGIKRISEGVVIDNSYFDSYEYPRKQTGDGRAYTAKTAATAVNFNSVAVVVGPGARAGAPGTVKLDPPGDHYKVVNKVVTGGKFRAAISLSEKGGLPVVTVTGRVPPRFAPQKLYRSVSNPALHAAAVVASWLEQAGVQVGPSLGEGKAPDGAVGLLTWESRPLSDVVADMNKVSNNFIAEQTLKHLGAVKYGAPGSTAKGVSAAEDYLASIGVPKGSYRFENGSGLSEHTRISSRQLVAVLVAAYRDARIRNAFVESLSLMGVDGTTKKWRFAPELSGRIHVKTGTLDGVSTLAGYAPTAEGRVAAFAILANGLPRGAWPAKEAQMGVVRAITENMR